MTGINTNVALLDPSDLEKIYETSLEILNTIGMKIDDDRFLSALEARGAKVDYPTKTVKFPERLLREITQAIHRQNTAPSDSTHERKADDPKPQYHWGGGPVLYRLDYEHGQIRKGTVRDALEIIRLADALDEIAGLCSTMVVYSRDLNGTPFDPKLYTLKSVALTAKHTPKITYAENIYSVRELEYLIELCGIVKDDSNPAVVAPMISTAKCVISPLKLERSEADILYYLATHGFPCSIGTMPILGGTAPVTIAGTVTLAHAEILGGWTALKAVNPNVRCGYVAYPTNLDLRFGEMVCGTPETLLVHVGIREVCRRFYGARLGLGSLYNDGKLPGQQSARERTLYYLYGALAGMKNLGHFGFVAQGQLLSLEGALADLETAKWVDRFSQGFRVDQETLALDTIREMGIGGNYVGAGHTVRHMRTEHWASDLFDRRRGDLTNVEDLKQKETLAMAHEKIKLLMAGYVPFELDAARAREIDNILARAADDPAWT